MTASVWYWNNTHNHPDVNITTIPSNKGARRYRNTTGENWSTIIASPAIPLNSVANITIQLVSWNNTSPQPLIYLGAGRHTVDRNWFLGGTSACDGWSLSLQSGRKTSCSGFENFLSPVTRYGTNITIIVDRIQGQIAFGINNTQSLYLAYTSAEYKTGSLYIAATLRNIGDELAIVN